MEKKGIFPTVKYKGSYLHSPYNPLIEAEKIVSRHILAGKNLFIIFEPGLGYAVEYIQKVCPGARFLLISPLDLLADKHRHHRRTAIWKKGEERETFLLDHIHESDLNGLSYIPWPPSVRLLEEEAHLWHTLIHSIIARLSGNHANIRGFGKKNLRNSIINFLATTAPRIPQLKERHILITAAGPSLQKELNDIYQLRKGYFLLALPSSVKALISRDIKPDLILTTDGGYWASRHFEFFPRDIPVGIALSGRCDFQDQNLIFPLFRQNTLIEDFFLKDVPLYRIPTAGTVALSAVNYALHSGAASITVAGLDLCLDDIKSHVSPHSFDRVIENLTRRTNSLYKVYFDRASQMTLEREGRIRHGRSLSLYREMMTNLSQNIPLYRLSPGTPSLEGWIELNSLIERPVQPPLWETLPYPDKTERREIIRKSLNSWRNIFEEKMNYDFISSPPDAFFDFFYTLSADIFSRTRQASCQESRSEYKKLLQELSCDLNNFIKEMEVLNERFF